MSDGAWVYILRCSDGSFYTGTARAGLDKRVSEHNSGHYDGYTASRRPVTLVFRSGSIGSLMQSPPSAKSKAGRGGRRKRLFPAISRNFALSRNGGLLVRHDARRRILQNEGSLAS
jgi:hypothetical protein